LKPPTGAKGAYLYNFLFFLPLRIETAKDQREELSNDAGRLPNFSTPPSRPPSTTALRHRLADSRTPARHAPARIARR
jgi:hypothetical protein